MLFRKRPIYTLKSDRWIPLWWAKFEWNVHLYHSCTSIQNSRSLAKTRTLNVVVSKLIPKKSLKLVYFRLHFVFVFIKFFSLTYHPEYCKVYFLWWEHKTCFKMVHSSLDNAKSRVYQSQACFLHTTLLGSLKTFFNNGR